MNQGTDLTTHDADVAAIVDLLKTRKARATDVVAPLTSVHALGGKIEVTGVDPEFVTDDDGMPVGVNNPNGLYAPSRVATNHLGTMLKIPTRFLSDIRENRPALFASNVNAMIHGRTAHIVTDAPADDVDPAPNQVMLRLLRPDADGEGILRAVLSDSYKTIDDLDVLLAVLAGLNDAGLDLGPGNLSLDVTDRKMYGRVVAPQIAALAPALLKGYRSPFDGDGPGHDVGGGWTPEQLNQVAQREHSAFEAGAEPVVFAGFAFQNSEVGHGAFDITPRLVVQVCGNGLTVTADALRKIHVGSKLDAGVVKWSERTLRKNLELITSQTTDAVSTYLNPEYLRSKIDEMESLALVQVARPEEAIKAVARKFTFTEEQRSSILDKFIKGGQPTAGGVMQAVTAVARVTRELDGDPDTAADMEALALPVLRFAAAGAR